MSYQENRINVGLAAYGLSGRVFHAPLLTAHSGFHLHSIVQRSRNDAKGNYPAVTVLRSFNDLLADDKIELVVVNTPEHTHFELAQQALEAKKHVIVEKAFTPTIQEAQALINLARKQERMLSVFQNSRWHGDFLTIKKILENQLLGKVVEYEAHYDRYRNFVQPGSWKEEPFPGTGVLYNLGSHMIDQALVLFGWPHAVMADLRVQRPGGKVYDNFEVVLHYDHLKVTLKSSYLVREPGPRYVLHGTDGTFMKFGADAQESLLKARQSPLDEDWGSEPSELWGTLNSQVHGLHVEGKVETIPGSYLGFYDNIYAAIREKAALQVTPEQAMQTIAIIDAAQRSHDEQRIIALADSP
ncbi:MAG: Gfo/Idh/MocA family oxidoreductase [Cyclobacteriaceae bacterium]